MQAAQPTHTLRSGPQHQVIGVAEDDFGVRLANHVERQRLDGRRRADRHEDRRRNVTARCLENAGARLAVVGVNSKGKSGHDLYTDRLVKRQASP